MGTQIILKLNIEKVNLILSLCYLLLNQHKMQTKKSTIKKNNNGQEKLRSTVANQLNTALPTLKELLGEKKFEKRINKVAKKLVAGIKESPAKKPAIAVKKATPAKKKA